ncbi:MAG TPA: PQQ-binding-like beta-propeller repeat protein [Draconibacterium sp.]|nr:PQQ-binding-like beta-propeller repeat protein [Draconibacterium sp.]
MKTKTINYPTHHVPLMYSFFLFFLSFQISNGQISSEKISTILNDFDELPKIKWEFKTAKPLFSSPVISENSVYFGCTDSVLYALEIESGKERWRFKTNGEIRSNVCIDGDFLYLNGGDGTIYKLEKLTGKIVWKFSTKGEKKVDFADYFHSSPVLSNQVLYFGSGDGYFYAVDAKKGKQIWKFKTGNAIHTAPAIANGKVFFGSFDGFVYALVLQNGKLSWKFKTVGHKYFPNGDVQGSPTVFKNLVFIGARDYNFYALDQEKGFCHWNKAFFRGWALNSSINDSLLYIGSADERVLIAADPKTGAEFWKTNMEFLVFGNNAYSETLLYVGITNGKLQAFSKLSGKYIWSFETETYKKNRQKYFKTDGTYRDDIYSIIKSNEQFLDVECELGGIFTTPVIHENYLIFTSTNGTLYCLEK